jgi:hypothetical protein
MPRSRNPVPSYLLHRQSGRGRAVWTDALGVRREQLLPGAFNSSESRTAFARLQLELETSPHRALRADPTGITVNELLAAYKDFAEAHYRAPDGTPTGEAEHMKLVGRYIRGLYGDTPAAEFGPLALKAVRQQFLNAGWCRTTVNQQTERVRRIFKWAASEELVPPAVYAVWLYRPPHHKTAWRGKARVIAVGPKAQELLREFFTPDLGDYLFSPRRGVEEVRAERAAARKTPRYPSHMRRNAAKRKAKPQRTPDERYTQRSYFVALTRACDRAFPPPCELAPRPGESRAKWWGRLTAEQRDEVKAWRKAHRWHPNQLRHTFATRVRKEHGLEAAQVLLGHSEEDVTQIYAEKNEALAVGIAAKIG